MAYWTLLFKNQKLNIQKKASSQSEKIVKFEMKNHEFVGNMNPENIVIYDIVEDWGVSSDRCLRSTLKNHKHIEYLIKKL